PSGPPSNRNGSAPGRTRVELTGRPATSVGSPPRAGVPGGVAEQLHHKEEEEQARQPDQADQEADERPLQCAEAQHELALVPFRVRGEPIVYTEGNRDSDRWVIPGKGVRPCSGSS